MILEGQILDLHTGYPVAGAEVTCSGPDGLLQEYSDEGGYFRLDILRSGPWHVSVKKSPYTKETRGSLLASRDLFLNICLQVEGLEEELVTA